MTHFSVPEFMRQMFRLYISRDMGCWVSQCEEIGCDTPFPLACELEVRYPYAKGVSQRYICTISHENKDTWMRCPLSDRISKGSAQGRDLLNWAALWSSQTRSL